MEDKYLLLRQYIESQGYTQDSLAKELGVDKEIMEFNLFEVKFANESIVEL